MPKVTTLTEPDEFLDDWYGWLTNQISHICLGVFLAFVICAACYIAYGEMPYRLAVYGVIATGYLAFELLVQGWRGRDTIEDSVFTVGYGASAVLASFSEIRAGSPIVALDIMALLPFFAIAVLHLISGVWFRRKRN